MKSINYIIFILLTGLCISNALGQFEYLPMQQEQSVDDTTKSNLMSVFGELPLHFIANQGQFSEAVVYYAESEGATLSCTEQGLVFGFAEGSISLKFSTDRQVKPEARGELEGRVNYFIGNDSDLWRTDIPTFKEVVYPQVYPGIDLVYSGNQRRLKYTFYLQPNSNPNQIQMIYHGIENIFVDATIGELVIQTPWGEMRDAAPVAYQEIRGFRKTVDILFRLIDEKTVGFAVGNYDPHFILTIDPGYSTYLGERKGDAGYGIAVDNSGNAYITGRTEFSIRPNAGPSQVFVMKLSGSGNALIYSTYLGGSREDLGRGIAVDGSGNVYLTGSTRSPNFPTMNPYKENNAGDYYDVFVTKLSSNGNTLIYSTYLGGSGDDYGNDIAIDSLGNAYATGSTKSGVFPIQNPYQPRGGGEIDAFVTKLSSDGSTLVYSTYLGGSDIDRGFDIAVDSLGNAYVTGFTISSNFPTHNPYQGGYGGGSTDAFVTKSSSDGKTLVYSTYLGGNGRDGGNGIAVDSSDNAYVTGYTDSSDFPTHNPYQGGYGGGYSEAFVTKFSSDGKTLIYSTYLGGNGDDGGNGIVADNSGSAYVTGYTGSSDFPTHNPYQGSYSGGYSEAFVTKLSSNGSTLIYSTYLGGSSNDGGNDIAIDNSGNVYVTGETDSSNFPTQNPYQDSLDGSRDAFVASFLSNGMLPMDLLISQVPPALPDGALVRLGKGKISFGDRVVQYSPNGKYIAVSTYVGVYVYNAKTYEHVAYFETTSWMSSIAFSPDSSLLASGLSYDPALGQRDDTIKLWSVRTGQLLNTLTGHGGPVLSVSFSPDGSLLASGATDKTIKLWSVSTGQLVKTLTGHSDWVSSIIFNPDGSLLASGSRDHTIKLWSVETGQLVKNYTGHGGYVYSITFSPDGSLLASGSGDKTIILWSVETGQLVNILTRHSDWVSSVSFSPDGSLLVSGSGDKTIILWLVGTAQLVNILTGHSDWVSSVTFNPDGSLLASASRDNTIELWAISTGQLLNTLTGYSNSVSSVSFSPDGSMLASGSSDKTIKLWPVTRGQLVKNYTGQVKTLTGHSHTVNSVSFSPDGSLLASVGGDKTIKLWSVETGQWLRNLTRHIGSVSSVSFSPDGSLLASGGGDKTIILWSVATGQLLKILTGHSDSVRSVSFSPDGSLLASGSDDNTIMLWSVETGQLLNTLTGHSDLVLSISFSPDGSLLASGSRDKTIKLWSVPAGQLLNTLTGYSNSVSSVAFSPDGSLLASGSYGTMKLGIIKLWSMPNGQPVKTLTGHNNWVSSVSFSPDGSLLASGGGTILMWDMGEYITPEPFDLPRWDANHDGVVDILDLVIVGSHFGESITQTMDQNPDINGDGTVDISDLVLVGSHFGESTTASPAAPITPLGTPRINLKALGDVKVTTRKCLK